MSTATILSRLQKLEERRRMTDPTIEGPCIQTIADENDDAEHDRQVAEQMRAMDLPAGSPIRHIRIDIVDAPEHTGPGSRPWKARQQ